MCRCWFLLQVTLLCHTDQQKALNICFWFIMCIFVWTSDGTGTQTRDPSVIGLETGEQRWVCLSEPELRDSQQRYARLQSLVSIQNQANTGPVLIQILWTSAGWSSVSNTSLNLGTDAVDGSNSGVALRQYGQLQLQGCDDGTAGTCHNQCRAPAAA